MTDVKKTLKRSREFVVFDRKKRSSKTEEENKTVKLGQKFRNQQRKINEKLIKIERDQKERIARRKEGRKEKGKLDNLAKMTENRLFMMSAVWPFDLFRNKVFIEEKQVILVFKQFFFTNQEYNILIQDILVPVVENSLLFSTLRIQMGPGGFQQDPPPIRFLPKKDAMMAKHIIMGLLVCHKEKINLDDLKKEEFLDKLIDIGRHKKN